MLSPHAMTKFTTSRLWLAPIGCRPCNGL